MSIKDSYMNAQHVMRAIALLCCIGYTRVHIIKRLARVILNSITVGGLILCAISVQKNPFLRAFEHDIPSGFVHTICKNTSSSNLPTAWFKEVNEELFATRIDKLFLYAMLVIGCTFFFILARGRETEDREIEELITLAISIRLPCYNKEQHKKTFIPLMLSKINANKNYFIKYILVEFRYMLLGVEGLILLSAMSSCDLLSDLRLSGLQEFAVKLNGSEWIVDCDRQVTSKDLFALTTCWLSDICITPTDTIYLNLYNAIWFCFAALVLVCLPILIVRIGLFFVMPPRRLNDALIVKLLRSHVDFTNHEEIIDAFEEGLYERRRATKRVDDKEKSATVEVDDPLGPLPKKWEKGILPDGHV